MNTLNERISEIINSSTMKKSEIANRLHISQAYVSQLCAGIRTPSDRTIEDMCELFDVRYEWLKYGTGEKTLPETDSEIFSAWAAKHLSKEPDGFKRRFIKAIMELSDQDWETIKRFVDNMNKPTDNQ